MVRVWLPDRPGALGQVASRIGALRGDVVGIDILERGGGLAVDELAVSLPDGSLIELLVAEIVQVDGVAVEDVRRVANDRPDAGLVALEIAARVAEADVERRLDLLCSLTSELLDGDWVVALDAKLRRSDVAYGVAPDVGWLAAFIDGSRHLSAGDQAASAPGDLAWARLGDSDAVVAIGRAGRPFHTRERAQLALLTRFAAALITT